MLELLREGLSNSEIGKRLAITERTARFHVSEILSKLGVATRDEAAILPLPERRRWWATWPVWARIAGAATMAAAAAGLAVLTWGVLRTGGPTEAQRGPAAPEQGPVLASAENPVPWADIPASSDAKPFTIPGVPPCQAANLAIDVESAGSPGAGMKDHSYWTVLVRNKGAPCFVGSTLDVSFTRANGKLSLSPERIDGSVIYLEDGPQYPGISSPSPRFGFSALGEIDTSPCTVPPVTLMEISPGPSLGSTTVKPSEASGWGTPCADETYRVQLDSYDCCGDTLPSTQTRIDAPPVAHPGERFRFLITVINERRPHTWDDRIEETPAPLDWSPCPTYHQELQGVRGTFGTYRLNCDSVNPMPAYASATFEMYIDVPADAQPGPAVLSWSLGGSPEKHRGTSINVWIEP